MSLIPSESENFPDSFRLKVGWRIGQQPEDPEAVAAAQHLAEVAPPAGQVTPPEPKPEQPAELSPQPDSPAVEEQVEFPGQTPAAVEHETDRPSEVDASEAEDRTEMRPEPAPQPGFSTAEPQPAVSPQSDAPEQPSPPDISEPPPDVAPERLSAPPTQPTPPPIPDAAPSEPAVTPPPNDMPFRIMPDPVIDQSGATPQGSQSPEMHALLSHILSAGVPISFGQPNGAPPAVVSEPPSFPATVGDLPVGEPSAPIVSPNDGTTSMPMVEDTPLPPIAPIDPVEVETPTPNDEANTTPAVQPSAPFWIPLTPIGDLPVAEPTTPVVEPSGPGTNGATFADNPLHVIPGDPVSAEKAAPIEQITALAEETPAEDAAAEQISSAAEEMPEEHMPSPVEEPPVVTKEEPAPAPRGAALTDIVPEEEVSALTDLVPAAEEEVSALTDVVAAALEEVPVARQELNKPPAESAPVVAATAPETPVPEEAVAQAAAEGAAAEQAAAAPEAAEPEAAEPQTATPISITTPVDIQQILGLIAAAVQRGELAAEITTSNGIAPPAPSTPAANPEAAPRTVGSSDRTEPMKGVGESSSSPPSDKSATASVDEAATAVKKVPVKIRITPRRIKPRPQPEPAVKPEVATEEIHHSPNNGASAEVKPSRVFIPRPKVAAAAPASPLPAAKTAAPMTKPAPTPAKPSPAPTLVKPVSQPIQRPQPLERHQPPTSQQLATMRRDMVNSDLLIFSARQRRNRWIGFGVSEFAAVAAFILLGRYGFTHHFPDPTLKVLVFILWLAAAAIVAALPIAFLRNDPARWGRKG